MYVYDYKNTLVYTYVHVQYIYIYTNVYILACALGLDDYPYHLARFGRVHDTMAVFGHMGP